MRRTVAEAMVAALADAGVGTVFGIPGVHNLALFDALDRSELRTVIVRHEASAAYAADAVGRLTGRPGVCLTTSGPGAANAVAAMGEAQASRSPLLHLTTTVARRHLDAPLPRGVLHEHPAQRALFAPVAKHARRAGEPRRAVDAVRESLHAAARAPAGPAYLEVPTDLLGEVVPLALVATEGAAPGGPAPGRADMRRLGERIAAARRPVVWVGSGAAGASDLVVELAERIHAPIVLTHGAKRFWDASPHPLVFEHPPHEPPVTEVLGRADAVVVLGSDLDGMMTQDFRLPLPPILRVDVDAERHHTPYASAFALAGEVRPVLRGALAAVPRRATGWGAAAVRDADVAAAEDIAGEPGCSFVRALDSAIAQRDAVVVCDMAISGYWTGGYLPLGPRRRILYPVGWGTLGFALPASIGAACASPGARVVVVCGDAGALFAIGELATLAQEALPVTVVVHDDAGYGMLRHDAGRRFGRKFAADLLAPDFAALAGAFGIPARRASLEDPLLPAELAAALDETGPSLVHVVGRVGPPRISSARWPLAGAHPAPGISC